MLKRDGHIVFQDIWCFGFHGEGDDWGDELAAMNLSPVHNES